MHDPRARATLASAGQATGPEGQQLSLGLASLMYCTHTCCIVFAHLYLHIQCKCSVIMHFMQSCKAEALCVCVYKLI